MICCAKCEIPLPSDAHGIPEFCPNCRRECTGHTFPAGLTETGEIAKPAETVNMLGEASCFYHESMRAIVACDGCGRYLCSNCQADWLGRTLCLGCIHTQREVKGSGEFQSRVTLYDNVALALLILPFLTLVYGIFLVLFTAPVALYLVIRHRNASRGIVPRGKSRLMITGGLSALFILGWIGVVVAVFFIE
ncbi:MAG: hypothetical protein ACI9R3_003492 [Verrucomicrobiales bacterium]|jgi:hypothetical protein